MRARNHFNRAIEGRGLEREHALVRRVRVLRASVAKVAAAGSQILADLNAAAGEGSTDPDSDGNAGRKLRLPSFCLQRLRDLRHSKRKLTDSDLVA